MLILKFFVRFGVFYGFALAVALAFFSHDVAGAFFAGLGGGILFATIMSAYMAFGWFLFRKRLLFYGNIESQLEKFHVTHIYLEGVAGDTTYGRKKYGGLFLTNDSIIFVPHRFAFKCQPINIPLETITSVDTAGINLAKLFSGGLGARLKIETRDAHKYEFGVWEPDRWIEEINKLKEPIIVS